jgi:hypothetical protein
MAKQDGFRQVMALVPRLTEQEVIALVKYLADKRGLALYTKSEVQAAIDGAIEAYKSRERATILIPEKW